MAKNYPFPEMIDHKPWHVEDSGAIGTNVKEHIMDCPSGPDEESRYARATELMRAKKAPRQTMQALAAKHRVSLENLTACENARMAIMLQTRGINGSILTIGQAVAKAEYYAKHKPVSELAREIVEHYRQSTLQAFYDTSCAVNKAKTDTAMCLAKSAMNILAGSKSPTFSRSVSAALALGNAFREHSRTESQRREIATKIMQGKIKPDESGLPEEQIESLRQLLEQQATWDFSGRDTNVGSGEGTGNRAIDNRAKLLAIESAIASLIASGSAPIWFEDSAIVRPPRPIHIKRFSTRAHKAHDTGAALRYPHRYATDQRIFAERQRARSGAVLIDHSGSMSFTVDDIDEMLDTIPGALIVTYCGDENHAAIKILAQGGRRVGKDDCDRSAPGGNSNDFPALQWFVAEARRNGVYKRLAWVSDQGVCPLNSETLSAKKQCQAFCLRHNIAQIRTLDEFVARIKHIL